MWCVFIAWQSVLWPKRLSHKRKPNNAPRSENPCTTAGHWRCFLLFQSDCGHIINANLPFRYCGVWPRQTQFHIVKVLWFLMALHSWYCSWFHPKWKTINHTLNWPKQHSTASWEPPRCTWPHFRKCLPQLPKHTRTDINNFYPFSWCQRSEMFPLKHISSFPRCQNSPPSFVASCLCLRFPSSSGIIIRSAFPLMHLELNCFTDMLCRMGL